MFKGEGILPFALWTLTAGCTVGQTGEEQTFAMCREHATSIDTSDSTSIGIKPVEYFATLQSANATLAPRWGRETEPGDSIEVAFAQLLGAQFVERQPEGISTAPDCPAFVAMDVAVELRSIDSQLFAEHMSGTAQVFENGSCQIRATLPKKDIQGEFGADGVTPSGLSFTRLALELQLTDGAISSSVISAESDAENRTPELIASWP